MDFTPSTPPLDNASLSSIFSLCPSAATHLFLPSVYSLLFLTALPGNAVSLWVFLRRISKTSPTHVYLSHLSISNMLVSLALPFLAAYYAWGSVWKPSGVLCQLVLHGITPALHINIYISLLILTWVALSRFAALIQHTHASRPSFCKTLLPHAFFSRLTRASFASRVCATVWVIVVGCIVPGTVYYSVKEASGGASSAGLALTGGCVEVCYNPAVEIGGTLSAMLAVAVTTMFFVLYLLGLLSYMTVMRHIRRSRRSANVTTSQSMLGSVLRNIVVIQVVFSVCLLPYHIFKPIFISRALHDQRLTYAPPTNGCSHCHPLSAFVELKNCLLLLTAFRGSTDPVMYFVLDNTFRRQILVLLRSSENNHTGRETGQRAGQLEDGNIATATADFSRQVSLERLEKLAVSTFVSL